MIDPSHKDKVTFIQMSVETEGKITKLDLNLSPKVGNHTLPTEAPGNIFSQKS